MSVASSGQTMCDEDTTVNYIAIMGSTGSGKSSFINLLSNANLQVGTGLESCTDDIFVTDPFELDGTQIRLIDTPGFDDTNIKDTDVLKMITAYLSFSHQHGKRLSGVIYMHRILDNRMGGISSRNFRLFRNLCGDDALHKVVLVTTMWDQLEECVGLARELELASKDNFFKPVIEKGARMARHSNTSDSARAILRSMISDCTALTLKVQEELEEGLELIQTTAGKELRRDVEDHIMQYDVELRGLLEDMREATRKKDIETQRELLSERERLQSSIARLEADIASLSSSYKEALLNLEERVTQTESCGATFLASQHSETQSRVFVDRETPSSPGNQTTGAPVAENNAILEGKLAAALPIVGLWGKLTFMLAPFSLTWR